MSSIQKKLLQMLVVLSGAGAILMASSRAPSTAPMTIGDKSEVATHVAESKPIVSRGYGTSPSLQAESDARDTKAILLTIRPTGFEPKEITVAHGKYLLVVRNRTGLDQFAFQLDRDQGARIYEAHPPRLKRDDKHLFDLNPGSYVLTETTHPEWTCRITVTAR